VDRRGTANGVVMRERPVYKMLVSSMLGAEGTRSGLLLQEPLWHGCRIMVTDDLKERLS
jgi:hypothetical protein